MKTIKYQLLKLLIPTSGADVQAEINTEKGYALVTGISANATDEEASLGCVFNKFEINNKEIFPEGYESSRITTGINVSPNDRFYKVTEPADGTKVTVKYKDGGNALAYPYILTIYLNLENA